MICCCDDVDLFISIKEYKKTNNNNIFTQFYTQSPHEEGLDEQDDINIEVRTLFDSGAINNNYINTDTAEELERKGGNVNRNIKCNKVVCSGLSKKLIA